MIHISSGEGRPVGSVALVESSRKAIELGVGYRHGLAAGAVQRNRTR
jgi:hypothetical protein